jgi:magnesium chelatase family protein
MMTIEGYVSRGYHGELVRVEVDLRRGIPGMEIVGLPDGAVREARERVRAALRNSGFTVPRERILINLAPADVKKEGTAFDLPIAAAILAASGQLIGPPDTRVLVVGELELSGRVRPVRGVLAAAAAGMEAGCSWCFVPRGNLGEARIAAGNRAAGVAELRHLPLLTRRLLHGCLPDAADEEEGQAARREVQGPEGSEGPERPGSPERAVKTARAVMTAATAEPLPAACGAETALIPTVARHETAPQAGGCAGPDYADIRGQRGLKRACEIAAAGGHHLLLFGPPGGGKSMAAARFVTILPDLQDGEALEATRIHSLGGITAVRCGLLRRPPVRTPHHTASREGLIGGGRQVLPGEISLAHRGVLVLDEALEFPASRLQALREPIERGGVEIARSGLHYWYPARFQLLLVANSCPCGKLGAPNGLCMCSPAEIHRYWKKLGAALMDRIDMRIAVEAAESDSSNDAGKTPTSSAGDEHWSSAAMRRRVEAAVEQARSRLAHLGLQRNAELGPAEAERLLASSPPAGQAVEQVTSRLGLSGRGRHSLCRIARTIADLDGSVGIERRHVMEAAQYRRYGDGDMCWVVDGGVG